MVVTEHFVFVHLHKCGGSFVNEALLRFVPSARRIGYHYPLSKLPAEVQDLPRVGVIRNPWAFYVSYHAFQMGILERLKAADEARTEAQRQDFIAAGNDPMNGIDVVFEEATQFGRLDFTGACRAYTELTSNPDLYDRILQRLPENFDERCADGPRQNIEGFRGMNIRRQDFESIRGAQGGLYTHLFHHVYGDASQFTFMRMESLREDLLNTLEALNVPMSQEMVNFVRDGDRINVSHHNTFTEYFTPDLQRTVAEADAELISRFDYSFSS
jgi:hypothetical protein